MFKKGDLVKFTGIHNPDNYWSDEMFEMAASGEVFEVEMVDKGRVLINNWFFMEDEVMLAEEQVTDHANELVEIKRALRGMFNF